MNGETSVLECNISSLESLSSDVFTLDILFLRRRYLSAGMADLS